MPADNMHQVKFELWLSDAEWCDFVSYDSRMPENIQLFVKRVYAKDAGLTEFDAAVRQFLSEVDAMESKWRNYGKSA